MVELVTRMMELKKQQARAPKKQSPSAKQLLDQKLAIKEGLPLTADGSLLAARGLSEGQTNRRGGVTSSPMKLAEGAGRRTRR